MEKIFKEKIFKTGKRPTKEEFMKELQMLVDKLNERDLQSVIIMASAADETAIGMVGDKDELFTTARDGVRALMPAFLKLEAVSGDDDSSFMKHLRRTLNELREGAHKPDPFADMTTPTDPKMIN